jgi:hypothetical protein
MKSIFVKIAAYAGFLVCLVVQAYLAVLLTTTTVMAQTDEVKEPVKKEVVVEKVTAKKVISKKVDEAKQDGSEAVEKIEKVAKKLGLPIKDLKLHKNSLKVTIDDDGKDQNVDIDLAGVIESAGKVKHERDMWQNMEDVVVPIGFFVFMFFVIKLIYSQRAQAKKEQMDTVRMIIEKGQPIPAGILHSEGEGTWIALMQKGIKLTAIGFGLGVFLYTVGGPWAVGAIPFFLGIGQIISAKVRQANENK